MLMQLLRKRLEWLEWIDRWGTSGTPFGGIEVL
jgi:hypothetical protein